jgi:hypothetical protein
MLDCLGFLAPIARFACRRPQMDKSAVEIRNLGGVIAGSASLERDEYFP